MTVPCRSQCPGWTEALSPGSAWLTLPVLVLPGDASIQVWGSGCPATFFTAQKTSLTAFTVAATTQAGVLVVEGDRWVAHKVWVGWTEVWGQTPVWVK